MTHFVEDVEVVLDVLKRAVLGEFVKEGFDLLFGGGHYEVRIAWRPQIPGLANAARPGAPGKGRKGGPSAVNSHVSQNPHPARTDYGLPAGVPRVNTCCQCPSCLCQTSVKSEVA